jgi:uncharacterized protein DUF4430
MLFRISVKKSFLKNIILVLIPLLVLIIVGINLVNIGAITTELVEVKSDETLTTLLIDYGNNNIDTYQVKVQNATVFSVLLQASIDYDFNIGSKYYDQYQCHYIYSINNTTEGENNKFWQYYLNDDYGIIGADLQPVHHNDCIEWKFQEPKI